MDVDATMVVVTVCLAATTIAAFGLLSYCSSAAVITMTVAVAMVSWVAMAMAAAIGLSGLSCSLAYAAITTAVVPTMAVAAANLS